MKHTMSHDELQSKLARHRVVFSASGTASSRCDVCDFTYAVDTRLGVNVTPLSTLIQLADMHDLHLHGDDRQAAAAVPLHLMHAVFYPNADSITVMCCRNPVHTTRAEIGTPSADLSALLLAAESMTVNVDRAIETEFGVPAEPGTYCAGCGQKAGHWAGCRSTTRKTVPPTLPS